MKRIAIVGGGPFGILSALRLSQTKSNQITLFERNSEIGGLSASVGYKNQELDFTTKFIPCNSFGAPGIHPVLDKLLERKGVLLEPIGDYFFLKDGAKMPAPPVLAGFSKWQLMKEARVLLARFPQIDQYADFVELANEDEQFFQKGLTIEALLERMGCPGFSKLIAYFSMIFGNVVAGSEGLSVLTSRNSYTTYNYLRKVFSGGCLQGLLAGMFDKEDRLNSTTAVPHQFLMVASGYSRFIKSLLDDRANVSVACETAVANLTRADDETRQYSVILEDESSQGGFDEVVLAVPMARLKEFSYAPIRERVGPIQLGPDNYIVSSYCKLNSPALKHLSKGIYLDYNNPHKIGSPEARKDGSLFGMFKQFSADTMFQSLSMVSDIDRDSICEAMVLAWWQQAVKEFGFDVAPDEMKVYAWKLLIWNNPFAQVGDFEAFARIRHRQGQDGLWLGGEILCGPGVPIILKYVESLFGSFDRDDL